MDKYASVVKCRNCSSNNWIQIDKGISKKDYCLDGKITCQTCGCLLYNEEKKK